MMGAIANVSFAADTSPAMKVMSKSEIKAERKQDSGILGWLMVVNQNEIAAAQVAKADKSDSMIRDYADLMIKDHSQNLKDTMAVSKKISLSPLKLNDAVMLKKQGNEELQSLKKLNNAQLGAAYINAMVKDHSEALTTLQKDISLVKNPILKQHLETTAAHVSDHLDKAKSIQEKLS